MRDQRPSISRDVHYVARGSADGEFPSVCRAAKVTEVNPDDPTHVGLFVMNPTGTFHYSLQVGGCHLDEDEKRGGTWHWPERVE